MRLASTLAVLALATGCGGPPIGEKIPRPDPGAVAVGAAAAAAATTLADPDSAGKKPEGDGVEPPEKPVRVKETVPENVLDRSEGAPPEAELPPCKPTESDRARPGGDSTADNDKKAERKRLELIPAPVRDVPHDESPSSGKKDCRDVDEEEARSEPGY